MLKIEKQQSNFINEVLKSKSEINSKLNWFQKRLIN